MSRIRIEALLIALVVSCGPPGPQGPPGPPGDAGPPGMGFMTGPSIGSVVPAQVTQGSEYDVTISGFATDWTDNALVTFGQGITVTRTKAASGTSLLVHIKVAGEATADIRDVLVTQDMSTVRWTNAFTVLPRVKFTALGTASQLSLSVVRLEVNEPAFEFDVSGAFTAVSVTAVPTFPVRVLTVGQKSLDVIVLANVNAAVGAYDLSVISRQGSFAERRFLAPAVFTVTPRDSMPLAAGVPENGSIDTPFQSRTYHFDPMLGADAGTSTTYLINVATSSTAARPKVAVLPEIGEWTGMLSYATSTAVTPSVGDKYWLVVWEASGAQGLQYTLTAASVPRTSEEEPNDTFSVARVMTLPGIAGLSQLESLIDVDYYKVTASALDVGKRFHVVTSQGDEFCDTVVQVFGSDGTTPLGSRSVNGSYHEDHFSGLIPAAGDYFVKVWMSSTVGTFDSTKSHYDLLVSVE